MPTSRPTGYVYALGRIDARFPSLAIEKEFAQVTGRASTVGLTDRQTLQQVLASPENRYLARALCWTLSIRNIEVYLLNPQDPADLDSLIGAIRPATNVGDVDVVVGTLTSTAPEVGCSELRLPFVTISQIYSFDRDSFVQSIPGPGDTDADGKQFRATVEEVFDRVMSGSDNLGSSDAHRALNYIILRYPAIYARAADQFRQDFALTAVTVSPSPLSGVRRIVEAIFEYTHRQRDFAERFSVVVDVTEQFPFLIKKLAPHVLR